MAEKTVKERYKQKYNSLRRKIRSMKQRGYIFDEEPLPDKVKKPTSASIRRIEKKSSELYKKSYAYIDGKKVSGEEYRKYERSQAAKKGAETSRKRRTYTVPTVWEFVEQAIQGVIDYCEKMRWEYTANQIRSAYEKNRAVFSDKEYGEYLMKNQSEIVGCCDNITTVYDSDVEFNPVRRANVLRLIALLDGAIPDAEETRRISDEMDSTDEFVPDDYAASLFDAHA